MLGRIATYVVPSIAVAVTALVLLGPGSQRSALGVRVRGVPIAGSPRVALRLEGVRRSFGVDDAASIDGLRLEASSADGDFVAWEGSLGDDGIVEANLASVRPAREWLGIRVLRGETVLAEGRTALRGPEPFPSQPGVIHGTESGDFEMRVTAVRGYLAAPFWDVVRIEVTPKISGVTTAIAIDAEAPGAEIRQPHVDARPEGSHVAADLDVSPRAHTVELSLHARDGAGHEGRWEGYLPVRPGALWIDPGRAEAIVVRSPSPRDRAYVSIENGRGRLFGAIVPLLDAAGIPTGSLPLKSLPGLAEASAEGPLFAVVAGDPYEQGSGTIAWPLPAPSPRPSGDGAAERAFGERGEGRITPPALEILVDGVPAAAAIEAARAGRARTIGFAVIGAAALAEVLLLIAGARKAQRRLEAHLDRAFADGDAAPVPDADRAPIVASARTGSVLQIAMFAALIALAFALVAAASTFR